MESAPAAATDAVASASAHAVLSPDGVRIRYDDLGAGLTKRDALLPAGRRDALAAVVT